MRLKNDFAGDQLNREKTAEDYVIVNYKRTVLKQPGGGTYPLLAHIIKRPTPF